jgi:hypothetical protein
MVTRYGKTFRTRRGRLGRYKYVNGRRVSFTSIRGRKYSMYPFKRTSGTKKGRYRPGRRYFHRRY